MVSSASRRARLLAQVVGCFGLLLIAILGPAASAAAAEPPHYDTPAYVYDVRQQDLYSEVAHESASESHELLRVPRALRRAATLEIVYDSIADCVAPSASRQQLLDEFYSAGTARLRQLAGFADDGRPIIIDNSVARPGQVAQSLRDQGVNARSVTEIFGPDPGHSAIRSLATQLDGTVVAVDRGRDALTGGGFQGVGLIIDSRAQSADSILRLLAGGG